MKKPIIGFGIAVVTLAGLAFIAQNLFVNDQKTAPLQLRREEFSADIILSVGIQKVA